MKTTASTNTIRLQERDLALIRTLAEEFRVLTREQIGELFPMGSASRLNYRLKQLRDAGFLSARKLVAMGNATKYGYFLGPKAASLFKDPTEHRVVSSIRSQASQLAESGLQHRLWVDSVHIRFLTSQRDYPNYKLLTWVDQYSRWWNDLQAYGVPFQSDGYAEYLLLLHFDQLYPFFLEVDRGTERGSAMRQKVENYVHYAKSGQFAEKFAAKSFRVLLITTSARRQKALLHQIEAQTNGIFWVTTFDQFQRAKLFDAYWRRPGKESVYSLLSKI